jgi:hypothetical protein
MKLKANWFSPLPPEKTDIANYTHRILPALNALFELTLWVPQNSLYKRADYKIETAGNDGKPFIIPVKHFNLATPNWLHINSADVNFLNIGNNAEFHADIWSLSQQLSCIVIAHDTNIFHLVTGTLRDRLQDNNRLRSLCHEIYGGGAVNLLDRAFSNNSESALESAVEKLPLIETLANNARAYICHTELAFENLKQFDRPVLCLPLPYASEDAPKNWQDKYSGQVDKFELIIFGFIGTNRRVLEFLTILSKHPDKQKFHVSIFGELWDKALIKRTIDRLALTSQVSLKGFVTNAELDIALERSHLAINLRYPSMGEASGSQLRLWNKCLPSLVTDTGYYSTLPDDSVIKVDLDHEEDIIHDTLSKLLSSPESFINMGERGYETLTQNHQPKGYASAIHDFSRRIDIAPLLIDKLSERAAKVTPAKFTNQSQSALCSAIAEIVGVTTVHNSH